MLLGLLHKARGPQPGWPPGAGHRPAGPVCFFLELQCRSHMAGSAWGSWMCVGDPFPRFLQREPLPASFGLESAPVHTMLTASSSELSLI